METQRLCSYYEYIPSIEFTAARDASNVNYFNYSYKKITYDPNDFEVYINDEITSQKLNYLTFETNDKIKIIKINKSANWPVFNHPYDIKSIDAPLPHMKTNTFEFCFSQCKLLESIPENLFEYNPDVTSFWECFADNGLTLIPENLFKYNTKVTSFERCFRGCSKLEFIPENLFKYNTEVINFGGCFSGCTSLKTIPENLFKENKLMRVTAIDVYEYGLFSSCLSLESIPENLFKYNTNITTFASCFHGCTSLTSIPEHLFDACTKVTDFSECFYKCAALISVPENLFKYNTNVTNFASCFYFCRFITSTVPELWNTHTKVTSSTRCFYLCSKAENYSDIPSTWR